MKCKGFLFLVVVLSGVACLQAGEKLTPDELRTLRRYQSMMPPQELTRDFNDANEHNRQLKEKHFNLERQHKALINGQMTPLAKDIDFFNAKIKCLEEHRAELVQKIATTQGTVTSFNQSLNDFISERIVNKSSVTLGLPVFKRNNVLRISPEIGTSLVVDMLHPSTTNMVALGGTIIASGTGKLQFVVLHNQGDTWKLHTAGEEIFLTEEDAMPQQPGFFMKSILFTQNFMEIFPGDLYGVIIDNSIGLTFDALGTSSSCVLSLKDGDLPETVQLLKEEDLSLEGNPENDEPWKKYAEPHNVGKAFSFNILGGVMK